MRHAERNYSVCRAKCSGMVRMWTGDSTIEAMSAAESGMTEIIVSEVGSNARGH